MRLPHAFYVCVCVGGGGGGAGRKKNISRTGQILLYVLTCIQITRKDMTQSVISFDSIMKVLLQLLFYKAEKCFSKNARPSSVLTIPHLMALIKKAIFVKM